jgi:hypothetical protein
MRDPNLICQKIPQKELRHHEIETSKIARRASCNKASFQLGHHGRREASKSDIASGKCLAIPKDN